MAPVLKKSEVKDVLDQFYEIFDPEDRKCVKLIHKLRKHVQKRTHINSHPQNEEEGTESEETENVNEDNDVSFNSEIEKSDCESDEEYLPDPSEEEVEETKTDINFLTGSNMVGEDEPEPWPDIPFGGKIEDKEWLHRVDHPLLNDLILKLVIGHVRLYDLKACRGVCKKWNEHTIPRMLTAFQVTIYGNKSKEENTETHRKIVDFVKLFKSNESWIPFDKYRLGPFRTTDGAGKQFLEICGDSIKEIVLIQPSDVPYVRTIENLSELLTFSPKLEALTISGQFVSRSRNVIKLFPDSTPKLTALKKLTVQHDSRKSPIDYCPTFFDELLSVAINISHVGITEEDDKVLQKNGVTAMLNSIEKLGIESCIQSLSLEDVRYRHVKILKRMVQKPNGLKLKVLRFSANVYLGDPHSTYIETQLATIFKDTLEDFYVDDEGPYIDLMDLPEIPKLKSLKCLMYYFGPPVNLNHIFPVIETLHIYGGPGETNSEPPLESFSQFEVCPTIRTLVVEEDIKRVCTFQDILRVFPNLRKVTLSLYGKHAGQFLQQLWARMTQLESLSLNATIRSRDIMKLDSLFTGIPIQGLNVIRDIIPDLEKMTVDGRREKIWNLSEHHKTQEPSIHNLTNLRHLRLSVRAEREQTDNLSDITGYFAIYLMKHLNHLDIANCDFTKTCCEILTRETGLEAWSFQSRRDEHIIPSYPFPHRKPSYDDDD